MECIICRKERGLIKSYQQICSYCIGALTRHSRENVSVEEVEAMLRTGCGSDRGTYDFICAGNTIADDIAHKESNETGYDVAKFLFLQHMIEVWERRFEMEFKRSEKNDC